jgi:flagellin
VNVTGRQIVLDASTTDDDLSGMIQAVDDMLQNVIDATSILGATQKRIEMQTNFTDDLMGTFDKGIGKLVDADMNAESARLKSLQVQQQLGMQSLSIANTSAGNVLRLFA